MTYFKFVRHDEPKRVHWQRWYERSGGVGTCPRQKLTYPYVGLQVYIPWRPNGQIAPEMTHLGDSWWSMVRGKAPNEYVEEMRRKRLRVYTTMLTIHSDYQKLEADVKFVRQRYFDYRVSLILESYSFWLFDKKTQTRSLNEEPPRFEIVADWISRNIRGMWSFSINVTDDLKRCAFEFSFTNQNDAVKFVATWR